jgi:hypothetical protein
MKAPLLKSITIFFFTLLIFCFVAYRAGALESILNNDNSPGSLKRNGMAVDTPGVKKDSIMLEEKMMMSSSKSAPIFRPTNKLIIDGDTIKGIWTRAQTDSIIKASKKKKTVMGSSKSGFIYEPEPDTTATPKK